jgi:hypothetical protein
MPVSVPEVYIYRLDEAITQTRFHNGDKSENGRSSSQEDVAKSSPICYLPIFVALPLCHRVCHPGS